jgi:uncharacterized membrane protein
MNIWLDEAASYFTSQQPFQFIWNSQDFHPPLHFLLLKLWIFLFGDSIIAMTSLSILFGTGSLLLMMKLFMMFSDDRNLLALFTATMLLNTTFLFHATQIRMYIVAMFFVLLGVYLFLKGSRYAFVPMTLALYTHYFTIFAFIPFLLYDRLKNITHFLMSMVLFAPYAFIALRQLIVRMNIIDWYKPYTIMTPFANYFNYIAHVETLNNIFVQGIIVVMTMLLIAIATYNIDQNIRQRRWRLLGYYLVFPVFFILLAWMVGGMYHPRYFFFFMPFFFIAVFATKSRRVMYLLFPVMCLNVILLGSFIAEQDYELETISQYIMEHRDTDIILHEHPSSLLPVMYYTRAENFNHVLLPCENIEAFGGVLVTHLKIQDMVKGVDYEIEKEKKYYLQSEKSFANGSVLLELKGISLILS